MILQRLLFPYTTRLTYQSFLPKLLLIGGKRHSPSLSLYLSCYPILSSRRWKEKLTSKYSFLPWFLLSFLSNQYFQDSKCIHTFQESILCIFALFPLNGSGLTLGDHQIFFHLILCFCHCTFNHHQHLPSFIQIRAPTIIFLWTKREEQSGCIIENLTTQKQTFIIGKETVLLGTSGWIGSDAENMSQASTLVGEGFFCFSFAS